MQTTIRAVIAAAAAGAMLLSATADAAVKVRFFKGQPTFVSTQHSTVVDVVSPASAKGDQIPIGIVVFNGSGAPASLGYENVSVRTSGGEPVKLVTYEELQHQARVRAGWATFFAVMAAGANGYVAARSSYGYVGGYRYYSPVAGQTAMDRATDQNAALFSSISQGLDAQMAQLDGSVLRTTTVDPSAFFRGVVYVALPRKSALSDLIITVTFAGEAHEIALADPSSLPQASEADLAGFAARSTPAPIAQAAPASVVPVAAAAPAEGLASKADEPRRNRCAGLYSPTDPDAVTCVPR